MIGTRKSTSEFGERCRDGGIIVEISASETEPMP